MSIQDITSIPNLEDNVIIDMIKNDNIKVVSSYLNINNSYFKKYEPEIGSILENLYYNNINEILDKIKNLKPIEENIIKHLQKQNINPLDKESNRFKLNRIIRQYPIPGIDSKHDNPFKDLRLALILEKYYQNHSRVYETDSESITLSDVLDEITNNSSCDCPSSQKDKRCPDFPSNFQKPVFNPCEYPHVLKLYSHFFDHCYDYRNLHALAGSYYSEMSKKITAPTLVLSALSSIASFVASSEIIKNRWKVVLTLSVGIMTTLTAMIQSFSSAYQFDIKANAHFKAADNYDQLITEIDFEKCYPNDTKFFQNLEKRVLEVKGNCQFLVPSYIKSEYYRSKEKANDRDFITKNIIKPMEHDLREAIIGGNMENYKFSSQAEVIKRELLKLRHMKQLFYDETDKKKCPSDKCCNKKKKYSGVDASEDIDCTGTEYENCFECGTCCLPTCTSVNDSMIKKTTY